MKIKQGLEEDYKKYVETNNDPYGKCAVDAGESVGIALDEGKTPKEAMAELKKHDDLTGFLAGCAIEGVCHYNPRGDELKKAWNKRYGKPEAKGVINPAIIEI